MSKRGMMLSLKIYPRSSILNKKGCFFRGKTINFVKKLNNGNQIEY